MGGAFSLAPLAALLNAGVEVVGCVLPGSKDGSPVEMVAAGGLPLLDAGPAYGVTGLARARGLPVYAVGDLDAAQTLDALAALKSDVGLVACFPRRLPPELLALPRHGFLNIHPSLLPDYRGPDPLFWTLRDGLCETGVTLHLMDEQLDTGDIVAQAPVTLPDGATEPELDRLLASVGGELAVEALRALDADGHFQRRKQPDGGSYQPFPTRNDFDLDLNWTARHAFNFMRGTSEHSMPYRVHIGDEVFVLWSPFSFDSDADLATPYLRDGSVFKIRFAAGVLNVYLD